MLIVRHFTENSKIFGGIFKFWDYPPPSSLAKSKSQGYVKMEILKLRWVQHN